MKTILQNDDPDIFEEMWDNDKMPQGHNPAAAKKELAEYLRGYGEEVPIMINLKRGH
jgi:hypothetical protein